MKRLSRRACLAALGLTGPACRTFTAPDDVEPARMSARPSSRTTNADPGEHQLSSDRGAAILYVPTAAASRDTIPVALMLHGAGGRAASMRFTFAFAEEFGTAILAPDSQGRTWDVILGAFGPDVAFINAVLADTFERIRADAAHIAIGGFSDGASYALSLGTANGDLFTHIIAFSPGFIASARRTGRPRVFVSHGTRDDVLPIDRTSRVIVPELRAAGYDVTYREFDGPHTVPDDIARDAFAWAARG